MAPTTVPTSLGSLPSRRNASRDLGACTRRDDDWGDQLASLPPTLIVAGDADSLQPAHLVEMYAKLGGGLRDPGWDGSARRSRSQLAILPGVTHYEMPTSPQLVDAVERFLTSRQAGS